MPKDNYIFMLLFLFAYLIQFSLSKKENGKQSITFIERVGEPQCSEGSFIFKLKIKIAGFNQTYAEIFSFPLAEPKNSKFSFVVYPDQIEQTISCSIDGDLYPLVNSRVVFKKDISGDKFLDIFDWDKIVGESAILSENATCLGNYKYEFYPNKEIKAEHKCLPNEYHEMKINGIFSENTNDNNFKSTEFIDITLSIAGEKYTYGAKCNITVFNEEINSNVYESEMICKFSGDTKAYILPKISEEIYFHDFPEYDISCGNNSSSNKFNLLILILFFCLLL